MAAMHPVVACPKCGATPAYVPAPEATARYHGYLSIDDKPDRFELSVSGRPTD